MVKKFATAALVGMAMLLPLSGANAQHGHGHGGHGHGGHGHSGHSHSGHSHSGHYHGGYGHSGHGHYGHGHGLSVHIGGGHYGYGHHHHPGWQYVVPYYDRHYHGTYYWNGGSNYYIPQTYAANPGAYVAAKPIPVEFGAYAYVGDLSGRLERLANELCLDLHYNYRHNPNFAEAYRGAYQILETAKYVHVQENQADQAEVARRVDELDAPFHQLQAAVRAWSRQHSRQIGQAGALTKLDAVEATLHHLMNDVGVKGTHDSPEATPTTEATEIAPPPEPETSAPASVPPPID